MFKKILGAFAVIIFCSWSAIAEEAPLTVEGATTVNTEEAKALFDEEVVFIDAREDAAWNLGRIPSAVHLDVNTDAFSKEALAEEVAPDEKVVFYCNGIKCQRSTHAATKAVGWGYKNVYYYREGFPGWKGAGYPVE